MRSTPEPVDDVAGVLSLVAARRGIDFRDYRQETVARGVALRIAATAAESAEHYRKRLLDDADEVDRLIEALVIPVTDFFRDAPVFDALEWRVLPDLATRARGLRAWAAGVATGEEAWSLAMLLEVTAERAGCARAYDVLASDVDARSLEVARRGWYPPAALQAIPEALRNRFLHIEGDRGGIAPALRERVTFAQHYVTGMRLAPKEAVIASFDIVLFRNVLIYFDRRLQEKAIDRLLSVVRPNGALVLGPAECMPDSAADRVEPYPGVDGGLRIFRVKGGAS